jgi:deoxyribonuclease V
MHIHNLHPWDVSPAEAVQIQKQVARQIRIVPLQNDIHHVAGADVSYNIGSDDFYAAVVVFTFPDLQRVEEAVATAHAPFPYIPGLLSFREAPVLLQAFQRLTTEPDVILFDGHGIAHPRQIGIASHVGVFLDRPSIGCAKKKLTGVYDAPALGQHAGETVPLQTKDGSPLGAVVRTKTRTKPLFVSPGHKIDLAASVQIVLTCCHGYKLPEPTRLAHHCVNRVRREHTQNPP